VEAKEGEDEDDEEEQEQGEEAGVRRDGGWRAEEEQEQEGRRRRSPRLEAVHAGEVVEQAARAELVDEGGREAARERRVRENAAAWRRRQRGPGRAVSGDSRRG
jgi:hypothetical protein